MNTSDSTGRVTEIDVLTTEQKQRIEALVAKHLPLHEYWVLYGQAYGRGAAGGDWVHRAKEAVDARKAELRAALCGDGSLAKLAASPQTSTALSLAFIITNRLVSKSFNDVDVVALGVLLAQGALLTICPPPT